jgi:hypothetical protein
MARSPSPPPLRTNRTRRVLHPVLIGVSETARFMNAAAGRSFAEASETYEALKRKGPPEGAEVLQ